MDETIQYKFFKSHGKLVDVFSLFSYKFYISKLILGLKVHYSVLNSANASFS